MKTPPTPPLLDQEKLVKILKDLQLDSMGVDLATPPEDNVEYLTDRLHRAEVQINTLAEEAMLEARIDELERLGHLYIEIINRGDIPLPEIITDRLVELRQQIKGRTDK